MEKEELYNGDKILETLIKCNMMAVDALFYMRYNKLDIVETRLHDITEITAPYAKLFLNMISEAE